MSKWTKRYEHQMVRDPKRLRAMAHPLRMALIGVLTEEGSATATRCAEVLNESVASCSYHLNILAKYDFIEHAPGGQGREKPWQIRGEGQSITTEGMDLEGKVAAKAAAEAFWDHEFTQLKNRARAFDQEPPEWRDNLGTSGSVLFVTAEELGEIRTEVEAIMDRFKDRQKKPELRPEGARPARLFAAYTVAPQHPPTVEPAAEPAAGSPESSDDER